MTAEKNTPSRFFSALFAGKPRELPLVLWTKSADSKRTTYALAADAAARTALAAEGDVYVGVGLAPEGASRSIGNRNRPSIPQLAGIVGLWADIDVNGGPENKTGAADTKEQAVELAHALLKPTILVDSGYGVQAWWLFDEPWLFGDSAHERQAAQELEAKWLKAHEARVDYKLDATHDPTRVLRVPGTTNRKGGLNAPVRLLALDDDARYDLDAFHEHTAAVQLALNGNGAAPADEIVVHVDAKANPPFEKFNALIENDPDFASAWARSRRDEKALKWSASEWDFALTNAVVRARWTDQEITDLLIAARRRHGDDIKRADYYARTLAKVRATVQIEAAELARTEAIEELTAPPVTAADNDPGHVLSLFEQVVGVPLDKFVQYGRDPDEGGTFELVLAGSHAGRRVRFPNFDELGNPNKFRNRIATATSVLPERTKGEEWDKVIRRLLTIVEVHDSPNETGVGVLDEWLEVYVANSLAEDRTEALRNQYPHLHDGKLYVSRGHLQQYLKTRFGERVTRRELTSLLKAAGFESEHVPYRKHSGAVTSTTFFARPDDESEG